LSYVAALINWCAERRTALGCDELSDFGLGEVDLGRDFVAGGGCNWVQYHTESVIDPYPQLGNTAFRPDLPYLSSVSRSVR